ncbi:hypothetical protein N9Y31_08130 [Alphaproteobacteria bacterium]|nr:hypothetical protein [Alphaproteobacteria bacterium]
MQNPEMESVEKTSNLVKSKAYQARSELEEVVAKIDAISARVFLGDRQLANQTTGLLRQQIETASSGITTDENIIKSLDHSLAIRARLLEHRCYLNDTLVEINKTLLEIAEKRNKINEMRVSANSVTAQLNAELNAELNRIKSEENFRYSVSEFEDANSIDALCGAKEKQNTKHLDALAIIPDALSNLRNQISKVKAAARASRNELDKSMPFAD